MGVTDDAPFHTALRWAIAARGLSLDRLHERLVDRGLAVSVSTLSNWQRGISRPRSPDALRALAELETLLELPHQALRKLLAAPAGSRGRTPLVPGTPRLPARRLRSALGAPADPDVDILSVHDDVTDVGDNRFESTVRLVFRARQSGVQRYVVLQHTQSDTLPTIRAGRDCALGQTRVDPAEGLAAAELLFAPLGKDETYALEYHLAGSSSEHYYGRWFPTGGPHYEMTLRMGPGVTVSHAYRIWRMDTLASHKDVTELRLIGGTLAHLVLFDLQPGFHGIRWTR
ncbi:hypothetical protein Lfu02_70010 [Longispora fulva]|uniref:Transcriptional regulator with XRE-family HTH domain n=1 Tax=Longispora fulva TaxID=619741 RepID=A0A8J7G7Q2_9ACTN|nr:hypothetical protein [Longispora fulva]MBG6134455.1 transcriptional regulator with XRE-family HTH domain [Longispora fulva]GIG62629.1 hypothetical protein Lfu02_70010 [Longispora fulva]